jgi:hypothetical protein
VHTDRRGVSAEEFKIGIPKGVYHPLAGVKGTASPCEVKGEHPLTSAAFLKNCCTKKLLILFLSKIDFRQLVLWIDNKYCCREISVEIMSLYNLLNIKFLMLSLFPIAFVLKI